MIPALIVFAYLAVVLYIGIFAFRQSAHAGAEPVQMFRHRWECGHIGTAIFVVQAALLVPYIIIGVMGGGTAFSGISGGVVPYWLGGAIVAVVVMS